MHAQTRPHPPLALGPLSRRVLLLPLVAGAIGSAGCQQPTKLKPPSFELETRPWRFGRDEGTLLITPHYNIYTTVQDPEMVTVVPTLVETAHRVYQQVLPVDLPSASRSNLYLFQSRNQWERFTRRFSPRRADVYMRIRSGGYAEPNGTVVYSLRRRYYTLAVIAHECLHMYIYRNFSMKAVPPWLNEGLACYCEGHEWQGHTPVFTPGKNRFRMNAVREALARGSLIKLEEMLATDAGRIVLLTPQRVKVYYAQAWSMVAFLMHGGKYEDAFARLRRELGTAKMRHAVAAYTVAHPTAGGGRMSQGEALFRHYITDDLERFNAEYGVWLQKITQPQERPWRLFGQDVRSPAQLSAESGKGDSRTDVRLDPICATDLVDSK